MMTKRGFTLIELLVSVGLIALVGTIISQIFFATVRTSIKNELLKETKQNGDLSIGTMSRMIRNALSISTTCASGGTTTPTFAFVNPDGQSTTFGCQLDGAIARIASVSASKTEYLSSRNVTLGADCNSAITFICKPIAGQGTEVQVLFTLSQTGTAQSQFEKASSVFQTTIVTRQ